MPSPKEAAPYELQCIPLVMLPGYGFPPLPDFQPHLHTLHCRGQSPNMWIPGSPESQALSEARKDRPFPRQPLHHVAVCKLETLTFTELPQSPLNGLSPSPSLSPNRRSLTPSPERGGGAGLSPPVALDIERSPEQSKESGVPAPSGTDPKPADRRSEPAISVRPRPPLSLPLFLPLSSPPDSRDHPHSQRSFSLDLGVCSAEACSPQRRTSYGDIKEKSIRRKMRVYSPDSLSDDSLSSPSPEYKSSSRDGSSGASSDSGPHSPTGPSPPGLLSPPADGTAALHKGSGGLSSRADSIEEDTSSSAALGCSKRLSRFLPSLILYQEYSDVAINREIQRQQGVEPGSEDEPLGNGEVGGATPPENLSPTSSFRSSRGSAFSLWQDIPDVRNSGTLDSFSNEERKLQEAKFELVTSEASYIRSLAIAVDHFMLSRDLSECLGAKERQWLFSKLPDVKDVSERFLQDLEQRLEEDILRFDVCDIVLAHCPALRRVYLPYVTNQAYQEQTYQRLLQENPRFPGILARLEEDPICQRLPLTSFLILPFQRITRLKMLVENILKRTTPGSRDEDTATKAFNELKKIIKECNSSVQSMKRTEELIHLNKKIHFEGKIFPLISQSRWLVKHGELLEVDTQTMSISGSKLKLPTRPVYLHLFNDRLLLSRKKDTWKFVVFVHARIGQLKVKDLSQKLQGISGFIFHLQLCDGPQLKHQILLKARTESEKQRWISAMFPPDLESSGEQVRENDDLSQVQCIKSYQAVEHDELTLEKADILQAQTITSDGWVEGIRLFDGERGWFPKSYVEEITSRSARLRNLRENNRIKSATQKLQQELL
ncbi:rho guanine nucleotide exchange factor 19-like isoform X3 [Conger conger]|uniref:rho guanine nucleotide exchange factor 19-like isoform X3 n=1 Tax=Conger conger TaxID=82655 RepID=UPI002A5A4F4E|nr:rho guanine nucleotide exchange factor 19-like isoform X3 [Conger conger]